MTGWRPALRIARRSIRRNLGRSLLVAVLVGLPVAAATMVDVVARTMFSSERDAAVAMGAADAQATVTGASRLTDYRPSRWSGVSASGERDPEDVDLAALLPPGSHVAPQPLRYFVGLQAGERGVRAQLVVADPRDPLQRHEASLEEGRAPGHADEVLISPSLADRLDAGVGSTIHPTEGPPLAVTGIAEASYLPLVRAGGGAAGLERRAARGRQRAVQRVRRGAELPRGPPAGRLGRGPVAGPRRARHRPHAARGLPAPRALRGRREPDRAEPPEHRAGDADRRPWPARGRPAGRRGVRRRCPPADARARAGGRERRQRAPRAPDRARPGARAGSLRRAARRRLRLPGRRSRAAAVGAPRGRPDPGMVVRPAGDRRGRADRRALRHRRRRHPGDRRRAHATGRRARRALPDEPLGAPAHGARPAPRWSPAASCSRWPATGCSPTTSPPTLASSRPPRGRAASCRRRRRAVPCR